MSLPTNPQSRLELYLNRIATGAGSIPPYPLSREEAYLEYIALNGGIGGGGGGISPESAAILTRMSTKLNELKEMVLYEGDENTIGTPGKDKFVEVITALNEFVASLSNTPEPDNHIQYTVLQDGTLKITNVPSGAYTILQDGTLKLN